MTDEETEFREQAVAIANRWLREMDKHTVVEQRRPYVAAAFYFAAAYSKLNDLTEEEFISVARDVWDDHEVRARKIQ